MHSHIYIHKEKSREEKNGLRLIIMYTSGEHRIDNDDEYIIF